MCVCARARMHASVCVLAINYSFRACTTFLSLSLSLSLLLISLLSHTVFDVLFCFVYLITIIKQSVFKHHALILYSISVYSSV